MTSTRHIRRGTYRVFWVTTIATPSAPTVAEINAGTELTGNIRSVDGFEMLRVPVPVRTLDTYGTVLSVDGGPTIGSTPTTIMYDEGTATASLRTTLAEGSKGWLVFTFEGPPVQADRASVFPLISMGPVDRITNEVEAAAFSVAWMIWDLPDEDVNIG